MALNDMVRNKLAGLDPVWSQTKSHIEEMNFQAGKQLVKCVEVRVQDNKKDDNAVWVICKICGGSEDNKGAEADKFFYLGMDKSKNVSLWQFLEMFGIDPDSMTPSDPVSVEGTMDAIKHRMFWSNIDVSSRDGKRNVFITPVNVTDEVAGQPGATGGGEEGVPF
jgi:hypothetical protein